MINKKDTDNQSFTISHIEGFISKDDIRIEERIEKKETFLSILTFFFKSFLKFYGIRILYSLYHVFSSNKKSSKFNMNLFFKTVLSIPNLRTALFGSVMPSIYKLILKIFSDHFDKKYEHYFVIFSALTSSLIGILIEEKTTLVNFITLSVLFRVIHTLLIIFCEKFNIPYYGKKVNYIVFIIIASLLLSLNFYHPSYSPVAKIIDEYAQYSSKTERQEMETTRKALRII